MFSNQTIQLTAKGRPVNLHLVSIGAVSVKTKFREARRTGILSTIDFIFDKNFTEWLPIWVMILEHPEGVFLIDTGECAEVNNPGYFRSSGILADWFDTTQFKFRVTREDEIDRQLQQLNISISQIKAVVLTHLHFDHTDGLKYFPTTQILVNKLEWEKPFGDLPKLYPSWFKPTCIALNRKFDVFDHVQWLTRSEDLMLIHTPGHTYGHCSVLFKADECYIFFAADICYSQEQLLREKYSSNSASHRLAETTYMKMKMFAKKHPVVFLPSHDAEASIRLKELKTINIDEQSLIGNQK